MANIIKVDNALLKRQKQKEKKVSKESEDTLSYTYCHRRRENRT